MHRHPASPCHAGSLRPLARALAAASLLTLGPALGVAAAQALPGGLRVVSGQAQVNVAGQAMTITNSSNAILNWQSFNIGAGNSVRFQQPGAASQVLNRVTGNDPSNILGNLSSNGRVWLINQNGVLFGRNARVDVAGLVTSTLAVNDKHWLVGTDDFATPAGAASASVTNLGELRTPFGGRIALLGGDVRNDGLIETPGGQVLLAAGRSMDLVDTGAPNLTLHVSAPSGAALNLGTLSAPGGRVDVQAAVVNQQGIVRADAIGRGPGGTIMLQATQELTLAAGSTTQADGGTGADAAGGHVMLAAGDGTALVAGSVSAVGTAGEGGTIELLGRQVGVEDAGSLDASGARGGGSIFMGGGRGGQDASIPNAQAAYVAPGATLRADATGRGDGGTIVVWSDAATRAYGDFSAQGGAAGGNGGAIETSGGWLDARPAAVSAAAPAGHAGRWLLDPNNLSIEDGDARSNVSTDGPDFSTTDDDAVLGTFFIERALNAGQNVTITTGSGGKNGESGDIVMSGATIRVQPTQGVSLSLSATQDILFNGAGILSFGSPLAVSLDAGAGGNVGSIQMTGSTLVTAGGNITLGGGSAATGQHGTAPFHGAVGHDSGQGIFTDNGVGLFNSALTAGAGDIVISGSTASGTTSAAAGVSMTGSSLSAHDIDILGWVDGVGQRNGVEMQSSSITASHAISIDGTALASWGADGVDANVAGVHVDATSLTVQPDGQDSTASLSLVGNAAVTGSPTATQKTNGAYIKYGVDIQEDGSHAISLAGGGSVSIRGSVDSDYAADSVGVSGPTGSSTVDVLDASGAASLSIVGTSTLATTQQSVELLSAGIVAPSGGSLSVSSDGSVTLGALGTDSAPIGTSIHGAPSVASVVAAGSLAMSGSSIALTGTAGQALQMRAGSGGTLSIEDSSITSTNPVQLFGNAVSLTGATVVTSNAAGDAVVLGGDGTSSMARFTNTAGAGALLTPNGRWLAYADDPSSADWVPGGLAEGFTQYGVASPQIPAAHDGNGFLFALAPVVTLSGSPTRAYDGTTTIALAPSAVQVAGGLVGGDTAAVASGAVGDFADKNVGADKTIALAGDALAFLDPNGKPAYGYGIGPLLGSITPKTLTVGTIAADNRAYDGTRDATIGPVALQGLVGNETLGVNASGLFDTKDAGTNKLVTVDVALANGANGGLASNYSVASTTATTHADITPKTLTIGAITADNRAYDGTRDATISPVSVQGLVGNETLDFNATGSFDTKDAGSNKLVTVDVALANGTNGGLASNYSVASTTATTHADITPKTLTIGTITADNRAYDGTRDATISPVALQGLVGNETLGVNANGLFDTKDAGTNKLVTVDVALANGANGGLASNYSVASTTATTHADITPKTLTVGTITADNRAYDGTRDATISPVALQGLVGNETLGVNANGLFDTKDAGTNKLVTVDVALANGTNGGLASNYSVASTTPTTHADIAPKALTIGAFTADNRAYDGTRGATISPVALQGLVGNETLDVKATGSFDTKDAGTNKLITVDVALANGANGGLASNYSVASTTATTHADITPKALTIGAITADNRAYDGTRDATISPVGVQGLVGNETLDVNATGSFDTKDAGTNKLVTVDVALANGANGGLASNYSVASTAATTHADITPKTLTVGTITADNRAYDGTRDATIGPVALQGLVGNETLDVNATGSFDTKDAATNKLVTVDVALANGTNGGLASNYALSTAAFGATADIAPRPVSFATLTASDKVYDGTLTAAVGPVTLDNLAEGERITVVPVGTFSTKDVGTAKPVTVSLSLADGADGSGLASNYVLTAATGSTAASITPKGLAVAAVGAANKTYDGSTAATVTGWTLSGVLGGDQVSVAAGSASFANAGAGAAKPVRGTATGLAGADASDYVLADATGSGSADIAPAILTYVANPLTAVAGAAVPPLQGSVSGFVAGETIASATSGSAGWSTPATAASPSGSYAVKGSGLQAANYVFVQGAGNASALTLTPLAPTTASTASVDTALASSLQAVQVASSTTAPVASHVFDATAALQAGADGADNFASLPLAQMSQESVAAILAARDAYKRDLFAGSIEKLQQTPSLADLPACQTVRQSETGECLTTLALTGEAQTQRLALARDGVDIEQLPPTAAGPSRPGANVPTPQAIPETAELPLIERRQVRNAALPQIERKIAIVIGVGEFQDKRIPELRNAVSDARSVATLLAWSLGYETIVLPNATRKTVVGTLNRLAGEIGPSDSVIIYYAGHGQLVATTGLGYWQLADADADRPETWLSNADIGRMLAQLGASQVALVSDSCYSGSLVPDQRVGVSADRLDPGQVLSKRAVVVMSSGGNEPVFDAGQGGHSTFAASLMQTLGQVSRWQAGGNVFERVRFDVARQLPQRPRYGASTAAGHQAGSDYLFEQRQLDDAR